ncbi:MAG: alpha/beta fold hydrolase [Brachymonas sp.]
MKLRANNIEIEVEQHGDPNHPAVLLVMGLGMQLIAWPPTVIEPLVKAGYRVITFDNRDIGLSDKMDGLPRVNFVWQVLRAKMGLSVKAPYALQDMALDALGVLDALEISTAHVVGVSMGGMIAQRMALAAPQRIISLTSIMSSSGHKALPDAQPHVVRALLAKPRSTAQQDIVAHYVKLFGIIGSPAFPVDPQLLRDRILAGVVRSYYPRGTQRQLLAIVADRGVRCGLLPRISAPTLVIHGVADALVPVAHGRDTAERIANSRFIGIEGMGHDLAPGAVAKWLPDLMLHLSQSQV